VYKVLVSKILFEKKTHLYSATVRMESKVELNAFKMLLNNKFCHFKLSIH